MELGLKGLVVEFELLPDLTLQPEWGVEITKILRDVLDQTQQKNEIHVALRVTPNDIREFSRPPFLRQGALVEKMFRSFELNAQAGADFLAIESTGGKEIPDDAILNGDLKKSVFAFPSWVDVIWNSFGIELLKLADNLGLYLLEIQPVGLQIPQWCLRKNILSRECGQR